MSTERVEINPDNTNESLEQSAQNLQKEGFGITETGTLSDKETSTTVSQPDTDIQSSEDRPEWLPEKFKTDCTFQMVPRKATKQKTILKGISPLCPKR